MNQIKSPRISEVTTITRKTIEIAIMISSEDIDPKADEYLITVNGRHLARLHPFRAERFGLIERPGIR